MNTTTHIIEQLKSSLLMLYIDFGKDVNDKDPKFKVLRKVLLNIFTKGYTPNRSEEILVIKKIKNTLRWT